MPFQQRTNTSCYLAIPTHGFTVVLSVFWGTPPAKPLKCKSVSNRLGARFRQRWTESTGGKLRLSCASIRLVLSDIIKTSFSFCSQCSAFRYQVSLLFRFCMGKQKPCFHSGKQGVEIRCLVRLPAHLQSIQTGLGRLPATGPG